MNARYPTPFARPRRLLGLAIAAVLVIAPGGAAIAESSSDAGFESSFVPFDHPPKPFAPSASAVDITEIEPPVEVEPEPSVRTLGAGVASYYGRKFHGRRTANGERFNMHAMTAAHRTLPFGTKIRVTNPRNGKSVVVRINDRGPFIRGRVLDVSRAAAEEIGMIRRGHARVELELIGG